MKELLLNVTVKKLIELSEFSCLNSVFIPFFWHLCSFNLLSQKTKQIKMIFSNNKQIFNETYHY